MQFRHYDNHSAMYFSWKERIKIFFTGKFKLSKLGLSHTGNNIMKMVFEWKRDMIEKERNVETFQDTEIK